VPDDNSIMLRLAEQLDSLSDKLQVTRLTQFHDYSALEAEYADFAEEEIPGGKGDAPQGKAAGGAWFDPQDALISVSTLCDHLTQHPEDLGFVPNAGQRHWPAKLIEELKVVRRCFKTRLHADAASAFSLCHRRSASLRTCLRQKRTGSCSSFPTAYARGLDCAAPTALLWVCSGIGRGNPTLLLDAQKRRVCAKRDGPPGCVVKD